MEYNVKKLNKNTKAMKESAFFISSFRESAVAVSRYCRKMLLAPKRFLWK